MQAVLQCVAKLNTKCLENFLKNVDIDMNPEAIDCINAFNIVLRHTPSNQWVFLDSSEKSYPSQIMGKSFKN